MKHYILYTMLFLLHTQVYSVAWFREQYKELLLDDAVRCGDVPKMQRLLGAGVQPERVFELLSKIDKPNEVQKKMYDTFAVCKQEDIEKFKEVALSSSDLWTGALVLSQLALLTNEQTKMFEYSVLFLSVEQCLQLFRQLIQGNKNSDMRDARVAYLMDAGVVPFLSVDERSKFFKKLVTSGQEPDIRDTRVATLMKAGVVPHIEGISKPWGRAVGAEIAVLWGNLPHDFPLQYALYSDGQDLQTREERGRQLAPSALTLLHFARSCKGGRSEHLRKCSRKIPNKDGGVTIKYCVPSLKSLAFDALAQGLPPEQVAELNRCAVAKRT